MLSSLFLTGYKKNWLCFALSVFAGALARREAVAPSFCRPGEVV
jgi:hypothetical protein